MGFDQKNKIKFKDINLQIFGNRCYELLLIEDN